VSELWTDRQGNKCWWVGGSSKATKARFTLELDLCLSADLCAFSAGAPWLQVGAKAEHCRANITQSVQQQARVAACRRGNARSSSQGQINAAQGRPPAATTARGVMSRQPSWVKQQNVLLFFVEKKPRGRFYFLPSGAPCRRVKKNKTKKQNINHSTGCDAAGSTSAFLLVATKEKTRKKNRGTRGEAFHLLFFFFFFWSLSFLHTLLRAKCMSRMPRSYVRPRFR
jgi:hypothetical protein